jgi:hypothetical protein
LEALNYEQFEPKAALLRCGLKMVAGIVVLYFGEAWEVFGMRVTLFNIFAEPACYLIGRIFIGIFSLGRWECDPMAEGRYVRVTRSLSYKSEGGRRRFTYEGVSMVGLGVVIGSVIVGLVGLCFYVR